MYLHVSGTHLSAIYTFNNKNYYLLLIKWLALLKRSQPLFLINGGDSFKLTLSMFLKPEKIQITGEDPDPRSWDDLKRGHQDIFRAVKKGKKGSIKKPTKSYGLGKVHGSQVLILSHIFCNAQVMISKKQS